MKISELRPLIKEEIDAVLKEDGVADIMKNADSRIPRQKLKNALAYLKRVVSPEGWKYIDKFCAGAKGLNRGEKIFELAATFGHGPSRSDLYPDNPIRKMMSISKGNLSSYENKDLYGLIDTGDLVLDPATKRYKAKSLTNDQSLVGPEIMNAAKSYAESKSKNAMVRDLLKDAFIAGIIWKTNG
jgi:hypothetical protein